MLSYEKLKDSVTAQELILDSEKETLIMLLKQKFSKLPDDIVTAIKNTDKEKKIKGLLKKIFKITSLDQVKKELT